MRHGLQMAGITLLWFSGLNIAWDCLRGKGLWVHVTENNFHFFVRGHWQAPCTAKWQEKCLLLGLCKEVVKESNFSIDRNMPFCVLYITYSKILVWDGPSWNFPVCPLVIWIFLITLYHMGFFDMVMVFFLHARTWPRACTWPKSQRCGCLVAWFN